MVSPPRQGAAWWVKKLHRKAAPLLESRKQKVRPRRWAERKLPDLYYSRDSARLGELLPRRRINTSTICGRSLAPPALSLRSSLGGSISPSASDSVLVLTSFTPARRRQRRRLLLQSSLGGASPGAPLSFHLSAGPHSFHFPSSSVACRSAWCPLQYHCELERSSVGASYTTPFLH